MWLRIAILLFAGIGIYAQRLVGDHVCQQQEKYTVLVEKPYKKNVTIREFVWCANIPPRCSKYKTVQKDDVRIEEEERFRMVDKCCDGYEEDQNRSECIPVCIECVHGSCQAPETCICTTGFTGSACNQTCPTGHWGLGCASQCDCMNGSPCNTETGYCQCLPDWTGSKCDHPVSSDSSNCSGKDCSTNPKQSDLEITEENKNYSDTRQHLDNKTGLQIPEMNKTEVHNPMSEHENVTSSQSQMETGNKQEENAMKHTTVAVKSIITPVMTEATELSKKNSNDIGEIDRFSAENSEHLFMDEIRIVKNSSNINRYGNLVSSISIAIAVAIILILIAIISILVARYKKRRNLVTQKEFNASDSTDNNKNRLSSEPIIRRSSYNAPLPDPPIFQNPVFTLTSDNSSAPKISDIGVRYTNCEGVNEVQYDYPPSTGSYRAASIPEPDAEPLYDEIPVWKQPKPVTELLSPGVCTTKCGHSCRDGAICEWQMKT